MLFVKNFGNQDKSGPGSIPVLKFIYFFKNLFFIFKILSSEGPDLLLNYLSRNGC